MVIVHFAPRPRSGCVDVCDRVGWRPGNTSILMHSASMPRSARPRCSGWITAVLCIQRNGPWRRCCVTVAACGQFRAESSVLPVWCRSLVWSTGGWRAIGTACPVARRRVGSEPTPALASQQHYERPVRRARQPGNAPKVPAPMCDAVGVPANRRSDPARRRAARSAEGAIAPWNRVDSTERTMT